ncbi:MAG: NAD-binding protein [Promethearchaeota archaeon]
MTWFLGFLFFLITQSDDNIGEILLYSITVRVPADIGDVGSFYFIIWPILMEVILFGFIMGELLQKYNPLITCRILARHQRNHIVVIGYTHLSERIIEYCITNKKRFSLIEDQYELVEDLITHGKPVVVGDPTEIVNLELANVKSANEIFITVNDVRIAIICTEKIRKMNNKCSIYVRAFEDHVQEYLRQPPLRAFSFSTSKWAMDGIKKWTKDKKGKAIVIGRDSLTHRIAYTLSLQPEREVYLFDDEHDGIEFDVNEQLHIINELTYFISDLRPHVNLNEVTQAFICWKRETEFDESLYIASKLHILFPNIEVFVRIFDEELITIVERFNAKTFSTSANAFKMLQKEVSPSSAIARETKIKSKN